MDVRLHGCVPTESLLNTTGVVIVNEAVGSGFDS